MGTSCCPGFIAGTVRWAVRDECKPCGSPGGVHRQHGQRPSVVDSEEFMGSIVGRAGLHTDEAQPARHQCRHLRHCTLRKYRSGVMCLCSGISPLVCGLLTGRLTNACISRSLSDVAARSKLTPCLIETVWLHCALTLAINAAEDARLSFYSTVQVSSHCVSNSHRCSARYRFFLPSGSISYHHLSPHTKSSHTELQ